MDRQWAGENPFCLLIWPEGSDRLNVVDLDEDQWATKHHDLLRVQGSWYLVIKQNMQPALQVVVHPGEQPYYTARHFGIVGAPKQLIAYGIGKKRIDGTVERLWLMPNGVVCGGDDVDDIGPMLMKRGISMG